MPAQTIYGAVTEITTASAMNGVADGAARVFGRFENSAGVNAIDVRYHIKTPIQGTTSTGTYSYYLVTSQDDTNWVDGINPTNTSAIQGRLNVAPLVAVAESSYAAVNKAFVELEFNVSMFETTVPNYMGVVFKNDSGDATPTQASVGASAWVQAITVSAS